jgi:dTDP-4-dehydrorhamnose 3,5-epimerase
MKLLPTPLPGVMLLETEPAIDARGSFARLSCVTTLSALGVAFAARQASMSRSARRGTLRGLHYQTAPSQETKIVFCIAGAVFDVALDLRPGSASYRHAFHAELSAANGRGLLIPPGCAHGLLTLTDDAAVLYQIDRDYDPGHSHGVRWNDPAFEIAWPMQPIEMSQRDAAWPWFVP